MSTPEAMRAAAEIDRRWYDFRPTADHQDKLADIIAREYAALVAERDQALTQVKELTANMVYCHGCSEVGGTERGIFHQPPVCETNQVVAERDRLAEELSRLKSHDAKLQEAVIEAHVRALPANWVYQDSVTSVDLLAAECITLRQERDWLAEANNELELELRRR